MDSVRFGRVLGTGARLAAKTLVTAVDAATAPNPSAGRTAEASRDSASQQPLRQPVQQPLRRAGATASRTAARAAGEVRGTTEGIARGTRRFGEAVWGPFARLSGVLWLELTGVFFGLFALSAGVGAWKLRGASLHNPGDADARSHIAIAAGIAIVFAYFSVSSFIRARRREHRR